MILIYQGLFLWVYSNAPRFVLIWFVTMATTSTLAFFLGYFIWKEQVHWYNVVGIVLIISDEILLKK